MTKQSSIGSPRFARDDGNARGVRAVTLAVLLCIGGTAFAQSGVVINGNVYGGGMKGQFKTNGANTGNTTVIINNGTIEGSVYGGGEGSEDDEKAGLVEGNSTVTMMGGTVERSIYGGGQLGSVGKYNYTTVPYPYDDPNHPDSTVQVPNTCLLGGLAKVIMSGGNVGKLGSLMPTSTSNPDDDDRGWIFCGSRGLADSITYFKAIGLGVVDTTYLEISGGIVTASVYGGCENGLVLHNTSVKISGGQIGTGYNKVSGEFDPLYDETLWNDAKDAVMSGDEDDINTVAANFHECHSWPYGDGSTPPNYNVYDYFYDESTSYHPAGSAKEGSDGHSFFGNVFGGGSGYYPIAPGIWRRSAGRVNGNTRVEITGGHILTSIYGGNEITDVLGKSTVKMTGGTLGVPRTLTQIANHPVTCYLFGGCMGDSRPAFDTWSEVNKVSVEVGGDAFIFGSVFGGGEDGSVKQNVTITINGADAWIGTWGRSYVDGNVFGGGRGFLGTSLNSGVVGGNVTINISNGTMLGSIFGGGRLASVGTYLVESTHDNYGQMQDGNDHGIITLNITGGTIGNDYEAVSHTNFDTISIGGNVFAGSMGRLTKLDGTYNDLWPNLGKVKKTILNISGDDTNIKGDVYGGGQFGTVTDSTSVNISGGTIWRDVFGGGYGSSVATASSQGTLKKLDGTTVTPHPVYPSQWAGRVEGSTNITINGGWIKKCIYGGGELASVGTINDSIRHIQSGTATTGVAVHPLYLSWPYQFTYANKDGKPTGRTTIRVKGGRIGMTGKDFMGPWKKDEGVWKPIYYDNEGNAQFYDLTNNEDVALLDDALQDNGDIFGGSKGKAGSTYVMAHVGNVNQTVVSIKYPNNNTTPTNYKPTTVDPGLTNDDIGHAIGYYPTWTEWKTALGENAERGCVAGAVYGGAEDGHVNDSTSITLNKGLVGHAIYGGGKGKGKYKPTPTGPKQYSLTAGKVYGNTHITVKDGYVVRSVFGGGNLASVGKGNYIGIEDGEDTDDDDIIALANSCGHTYVNIYGGELGMLPIDKTKPDDVIKDSIPYGSVFGGSRGRVVNGSADKDDFFGYVNFTHVTIGKTVGSLTDPRLYGSVYGGAQDGHVRRKTNVTVNAGKIGVEFVDAATALTTVGNNNSKSRHWTTRGNVYGGGSGVSPYDESIPNSYSPIAGSVLGGTNVTINGGLIHRIVFGGGSLAKVNGKANVTVNSTIGVNDPDHNNVFNDFKNYDYGGYVFGGGRGITKSDMLETYAFTDSTEVTFTAGIVPGDIYGGGAMGQVTTDTKVTMTGGQVGLVRYTKSNPSGDFDGIEHVGLEDCGNGSVYGGGMGIATMPEAARVKRNTDVTIGGGHVYSNVYGGGKIASVGLSESYTYNTSFTDTKPAKNASNELTGVTHVTITGGQIGPEPRTDEGYNIPVGINGTDGYVFGGGKGISNDNINGSYGAYSGSYYGVADVNYTYVTVDIPSNLSTTTNRIWASIYGGAEDGHVLGNTHVKYKSGLTGPDGAADYGGNIFGSGRNMSMANYNAGRVRGNTYVHMCGGQIYGAIFGGGRYALTGVDLYGNIIPDDVDGGNYGKTNVRVNGGKIGNDTPTSSDLGTVPFILTYTARPMGDVYGGGKGSMTGITGHPVASALLVSLVKNTEVLVTDTIIEGNKVSPKILGSVFGGGEVANVGHYTWQMGVADPLYNPSNPDPNHPTATTIGNIDLKPGTGITRVTISGGQIGLDKMRMYYDLVGGSGSDKYNLKYNCDLGHVFGGGEGIVANPASYATVNPCTTTNIHKDKSLIDLMATVGETHVTIAKTEIDSAFVKASVYGGSMSGHVLRNSNVTVSGGQIGAGYNASGDDLARYQVGNSQGKLFNPLQTTTAFNATTGDVKEEYALAECHSWTYDEATKRPFDPVKLYTDYATNNNYDNSKPTDGKTWFGQVFGGGSGYYPYIGRNQADNADSAIWNPECGKVYGNSTVRIKGGHILTNVYGGGEISDVTGTATVTMSDGTVGVPRTKTQIDLHPVTCYLFGGGEGNPLHNFDAITNVSSSSVTVCDSALVYGSVFGGAENGHVLGHASVEVKQNEGSGKTPIIGTTGFSGYDGHVFGGGKGEAFIFPDCTTANFAAGRVGGNATVTMSAGNALGNLYGGGFVARTGVGADGGFDEFVLGVEYDSLNHGKAKVALSGGFIGNPAKKDNNAGWYLLMSEEKSGNVYGGGRGDPDEYIEDDLGRSANSAVVIISSPTIYGSVFGGGQMANAGHWLGSGYAEKTSFTEVKVSGSPTIGTELEFDREKYAVVTPNLQKTQYDTINGMRMISHTRTGNVFGGGQGDIRLKTSGTWAGHPEGLEQGHCGGTKVTIGGTPIIRSSVFGGSEQGTVWGDTRVNITGGTIGTQKIYYDSLKYVTDHWEPVHHDSTYSFGSVYGGSYGLDAFRNLGMSVPTTDDGRKTIDSINDLAGRVYGNATVSITGGTIRGNVFGGGQMASVGECDTIFVDNEHNHQYAYAKDLTPVANTGEITVSVSGTAEIGPLDGTGLNAYVFGGGKGFNYDPNELRKSYANVNTTDVTVSGGKIWGSVFGGGSDSHVLGNAEVKVHSGADIGKKGITTWDGNIFGGGRNFLNSNHTNGRVAGNVTITMDGGTIQGSIFGGGRMALTGVDLNAEPYFTTPTSQVYDSTYHGLVTIDVSGGSIGNSNGDELLNGSDESVGDIFGSGKGDTREYDDILAGRVANTKVTVSGSPRIYGSVFGGGEMASIGYWYTDNSNSSHPKSPFYDKSGVSNVIIQGSPVIGTDMEFRYDYAHDDPDDPDDGPSYWTVFNYNASDIFDSTDSTLLHTCTGNVFGGSQGDVDTIAGHWVSMGRSRKAYVTVNMSAGGHIKSRVFGGAEQGSVAGNTYVLVKGSGTIGSIANSDKPGKEYLFGGVFGGGYGSHNPIFNGTETAYYHTPIVNDSTTALNTAYPGKDLWTANHLAGRVYGDIEVKVLGATIQGDVFGGASFAYVGGYAPNADGNVLLNIGKVTSRDSYEGSAVIQGSVFGANNCAGTPFGDVNVNVYATGHEGNPSAAAPSYTDLGNVYPSVPTGMTEEQQLEWLAGIPADRSNFALYQVFGGSNLADYTPLSGKKATVHVYDCSSNTIYDLYGGSNAAAIGTSSQSNDANVIVDGGRIHRVFGGGNGEVEPADIHGTAKTEINGGLINQVFGGSNTEGLVDNIALNINHESSCLLLINDVFGGGNNAVVIGDVVTTVECCNATYSNFYGGNSLANIYGDVTVNIFGATYERLFAGSKGDLASLGSGHTDKSADIKKFPAAGYNWTDNPDGHPLAVKAYMIAHSPNPNLNDPSTSYLCGEGGNVTLNLFGGKINKAAYGGSDVNGNIEGKITVNVFNTATTCDLDLFDLYGASRNTAYTPLDATITSPEVNIIHGTVKGSVYGGGDGPLAHTTANPKVNMGYYAALGDPATDETIMNTLYDTIHAHTDQPGSPWTGPTLANYAAYVYGNIYGGGDDGQVNGSTMVNVYKGEVGRIGYTYKHNNTAHTVLDSIIHVEYDATNQLIGGSVFGGGAGSTTVGQEEYGRVTKNSTVNISGGHVYYNVYGGGEMASVGQHTPVYQTPGDDTTPLVDFDPVANTGLATVNITGGQVGPAPRRESSYNVAVGLNGTDGYVFGGGKGLGDDPITSTYNYGKYYQFANVNNAVVTVDMSMTSSDTLTNRIWGSVFGGSEDGHVLGSDTVRFISGYMGTTGTTSYDGNIFGGGRNYSHKNYTAGRVAGNTTVEMTGGQLFGNIYGGGRLALTGVGLRGMIPATGLGDGYYQAMQEGTGHGYTKVMVKGGTIGNNKTLGTGDLLIETFSDYSMGSVYGGGMGTLDGIDIAGHPKASSLMFGMTKNTVVEISDTLGNNTHVYGIVFGGGEIANVGKYTWKQEGTEISKIDVAEGKAKVTISGGTIGADMAKMRYEKGTAPYAMYPKYNDDLGYVYGAGEGYSDDPLKEEAGVRVYPNVNTASFGDLSLLDLMSSVYETEVTITNDTVGAIVHRPWVKASVFGGSESGHVMGNTKVTISGGQIGAGHNDADPTDTADKLYAENQFINPTTQTIPSDMYGTYHWNFGKIYNEGASNEVTLYMPYDPVLAMKDTIPSDGKSWFGNVFGGGSGWFPYITEPTPGTYESHWNPISGKVWGNTEVIITGGHILNNVYGANESTDVRGTATIRMSGGTVGVPLSATRYAARPLLGYIYGGGSGDPRTDFDGITNVASTDIQITGGTIYGSVIGGSEDGHILGDTKVTVSGSTAVIGSTGKSGVDGNIFGGGRNFFGDNKNAGHVTGKTTINMSNGVALGNVYGGGRFGSVDKSAHVNISGGFVGTAQVGDPQASIVNGLVFGGGLGKAGGKRNGNAHEFANVDSTYVKISDNAMIYNSVFGGGDNGHVLKSTVVTMTGGTVGQKNTLAELTVNEYEQPSSHIYTGSVLGGGRGVSMVSGVYNDTTGIVFGNTNVTISGGTVRHAVYGGGGLSHVGTFTRDATTNEITFTDISSVVAGGGGKCTVEVKGNALIGPKKDDLDGYSEAELNTFFSNLGGNSGWVFGAGCGLAEQADLTFNDSTFVTISESAQVTGAVFGGGENGHVKNNTRLLVSGGTIGGIPLHGEGAVAITSGPYQDISYASTVDELAEDEFGAGCKRVFRGNVHGGGKGNDFVDVVNKKYSPTAGRVYGNAKLEITGGTIYNRVFGGGLLASVGDYNYHNVATDSIIGLKSGGTINVIVSGGQIGTGTNGTDGKNNGDVFGGGRGIVGRHWEPTYTTGDQVVNLAYVANTHVTIKEGANIRSSVFGGSANGHVLQDAHVTVKGGNIGYTYDDGGTTKVFGGWHSNVYGGGGGQHQYQRTTTTKHFSITSGRVFGNTHVTIEGGNIAHNVYGGGAIASVGTYNIYTPSNYIVPGTGTAEVTITGGTIGSTGDNNGMVFGSGRGQIAPIDAFMDSLSYVVSSTVTIGTDGSPTGPKVKGSVYGSGENGHVYEKATVNIYSGTVGCDSWEAANAGHFANRGNVYGAGCGTDMYDSDDDDIVDAYNPRSGMVWGNTEVNVTGGKISHNVYGGGAMALVGTYTTASAHWTGGITGIAANTGKTTVNISGGQIGTSDVPPELVNVEHGNVYGGSRGPNSDTGFDDMALTDITNVFISGSANVLGSVYGGGEMSWTRTARVATVSGGTVNKDVYGGGKDGIADNKPFTSLKTVNVRGGHIKGNVFGSSYNAKEKATPASPDWSTNTYWSSFVNISGGTIDENVYAAGYGGTVDGSVCANIGLTAIKKAPTNESLSPSATLVNTYYNVGAEPTRGKINIGGDVFGGAFMLTTSTEWDYNHNVTGYSTLFIDGDGYDTESSNTNDDRYMNIAGGIYGSGNWSESGEQGSIILLRRYGERTMTGDEMTNASRTLTSIQRAGFILLDSTNVHLVGAPDISRKDLSREFSILKVGSRLYSANGSGIVLGGAAKPAFMDSIHALSSLYLKAGTLSYDQLGGPSSNWEMVGIKNSDNTLYRVHASGDPTALARNKENVILFGGVSQLWVRYVESGVLKYGELNGFFRMRSNFSTTGTQSFAYARPKLTPYTNTIVGYNETGVTDTWNAGDGGFLSYDNSQNSFVTHGQEVLGHTYNGPTGDDGGAVNTNTMQYPYYNITEASRGNTNVDMIHYREWVQPTILGRHWYVDGRGVGTTPKGWGQDKNHQLGWGHYPDMPKASISGDNGVCYDVSTTPPNGQLLFNQEEDVIFVVGPVEAVLEKTDLNKWPAYPLKLYRYPGGHQMTNGLYDATDLANPSPVLDTMTVNYAGLSYGLNPSTNTAGPGPNYGMMIHVPAGDSLMLNNVIVDGIYSYNSADSLQFELPANASYHTERKKVNKPMVVVEGTDAKLALKNSELKRGYNNTDASVTWYNNIDYEPEANVYHGGAMYVDANAKVYVEGLVNIVGNRQKNGSGEPIWSNVYLPTFETHLRISNTLDDAARIGITSPIRKQHANPAALAASTYLENTFSPVAMGVRPGKDSGGHRYDSIDARAAWTHANFSDDLSRFFANGHDPDNYVERTTYYNPKATTPTNSRTVYFGWTWANIVLAAPTGYDDSGSTVVIDSKDDLAWLASRVNGLNGQSGISMSTKTVTQTADLDMKQYVWVPIGASSTKPFSGTYDGQGHLIENLEMAYIGEGDRKYGYNNIGMFGYVQGGTIDRTFVVSGINRPEGLVNIGGLVGTLQASSTLKNSEAALRIVCPDLTAASGYAGGLVGLANGGTIHSSMAMPDIECEGTYGYVGGLLGGSTGTSYVYNSFANAKFTLGTALTGAGGLVGNCSYTTLKNCYIHLYDKGNLDTDAKKKFGLLVASGASSTIEHCYAFDLSDYGFVTHTDYALAYNSEGLSPTLCGKYSPAFDSDTYGYLSSDIAVTLSDITKPMYQRMNDNIVAIWGASDVAHARWARPTLSGINGDFPVPMLCNYDDSDHIGAGDFRSVGNYGTYALQYGGTARDGNEVNTALARPDGVARDYLFIYGDVTEIISASITVDSVAIHEDVAILHPGTLASFDKTFVGVSFDNSSMHSHDAYGNVLGRDWHMFSTPLSNAPLGINYTPVGGSVDENVSGVWDEDNPTNNQYVYDPYKTPTPDVLPKYRFTPAATADGYFPSKPAPADANSYSYEYDFRTWYEPDWQWINFKRNGVSHWHYDEKPGTTEHRHIDYRAYFGVGLDPDAPVNVNESIFIPGKGYMMAIQDATYLQSHGNLNAVNKTFKITNSINNQNWTWVPEAFSYYGNNLVGNPYHAYLDFGDNTSGFGKTNGLNSYYMYNADKDGYRIYPIDGSLGGDYAPRYIHPHQGFFVQTTDADKEITFDVSANIVDRVTAGTSPYRYMPSYRLVNLYAYDPEGNGDVVVIEFDRPENGGGQKVKALRNGNHLIYAHHDTIDYGAFFAEEGTRKVPVRFRSYEEQSTVYTLKWNLQNGYFPTLYLVDNMTGTYYDMTRNDTYTFLASKEDYLSRFYITFDYLDVEENEVESFVFFDGSSWVVNGRGYVELFDMTGRCLYTNTLTGDQSHLYFDRFAKGVYTLRLTDGKTVRIQKIVKQ